MKSKLLLVLAASAIVFALTGCSSSGDSAVGVWGTPNVTGKPSLDLKKDGSLSGSDGCNRLTGSWKQSGSDVTFGPIASTLMFCEGVDTWLQHAHTATVSGQTLTVFNQQKKEIGTLTESK